MSGLIDLINTSYVPGSFQLPSRLERRRQKQVIFSKVCWCGSFWVLDPAWSWLTDSAVCRRAGVCVCVFLWLSAQTLWCRKAEHLQQHSEFSDSRIFSWLVVCSAALRLSVLSKIFWGFLIEICFVEVVWVDFSIFVRTPTWSRIQRWWKPIDQRQEGGMAAPSCSHSSFSCSL